MQLDSARELKAQLLKLQVKPLARAAAVSALALSARALNDIDKNQPTIVMGIAQKGKRSYQLAVRIQSRALENSGQIETIRKQAKQEVDVRYVGSIVKRDAEWNRKRHRPLEIGISIAHYRVTAGTLGCFVQTRNTHQPRMLSNNHVFAHENDATKGDAILQAGRYDGGRSSKDTVGGLDRFIKLIDAGINYVDCATGTIRKGIDFEKSTLNGGGQLKGLAQTLPDVQEKVSKMGRTTGLTHGRITAFELDNVIVKYEMGNLRFDNQIEIEPDGQGPFSQGGDSGSLIYDSQGLAVALLFAGGDQGGTNGQGLTFANPIARVFDDLEVDLLC